MNRVFVITVRDELLYPEDTELWNSIDCPALGDKIKQNVVNNILTEKQLEKYRKQKQGLYYKLNRLNKLKQRKKQLEYEIDNKVLKIGFGGKKIFDNHKMQVLIFSQRKL